MSPFMVACLMMAMVTFCDGLTTFMNKLQNVGNGDDEDATLLDIVLAVWPELWYKLTPAQQEKIACKLETQHCKVFPRKPVSRTTVPPATNKVHVPDNNRSTVTKPQPPKTKKPHTPREKATVYNGGPQVISMFGVSKRPIEGPLKSMLEGSVTDFPQFMEATASTRNPLVVARLLFLHEESLFDKLAQQLKALVAGIVKVTLDDPMHIALYTAVSCWPSLYEEMTEEEQMVFQAAYKTTVEANKAKREAHLKAKERKSKTNSYHKDSSSNYTKKSPPAAVSIETCVLEGFACEIYPLLMSLFCKHKNVIENETPDLAKRLEPFMNSPTYTKRSESCKEGACAHHKRCGCQNGKCATKYGCAVAAKGNVCKHRNGNILMCQTKFCPKMKCGEPARTFKVAGSDLLSLLYLFTFKGSPVYAIGRYLMEIKYYGPIVQNYTSVCGLSPGQAAMVCFAMHNVVMATNNKGIDYTVKLLFKQSSEWWDAAYSMMKEVGNCIPTLMREDFQMLSDLIVRE